MTDPLHDKLQKLARLAVQGVGGEASNAEKIFSDLLARHGLQREDFINPDQKKIRVSFKVPDKNRKTILIHVAMLVLDDWDFDTYRIPGQISPVRIDVTPAQAAEIRFLFSIYSRAWEEEIALFRAAFVNKHRLFPPTARNTDECKPMSRDNERRLERMMDSLAKVTPRKALEERR